MTTGQEGIVRTEAKPLLISVDKLQPDLFLVDGDNEKGKDAHSGSRTSFLSPSFIRSLIHLFIQHLITES